MQNNPLIESIKDIIKYILIGLSVIFVLGIGLLVMVYGALIRPLFQMVSSKFKSSKGQGEYEAKHKTKGPVIEGEFKEVGGDKKSGPKG